MNMNKTFHILRADGKISDAAVHRRRAGQRCAHREVLSSAKAERLERAQYASAGSAGGFDSARECASPCAPWRHGAAIARTSAPPRPIFLILVDTSVWVDHLRRGDAALVAALEADTVVAHAFVVGELACGQLKSRHQVLSLLRSLTQLAAATDDEALYFLERHRLFGHGLGYIDVHLLAAAALNRDALLWTRDKPLKTVAAELGLAHVGPAR